MLKRRTFGHLAIIAIAVMLSSAAVAQVSLPNVNLGNTSFEDGVRAPGAVFEQYVVYGASNVAKDSQGNTIPGYNSVATTVSITHGVYLSKHRLFGGLYGVEALLPFADAGVNNPHVTARERGIGDLTISPFMLAWDRGKLAGMPFPSMFTFDITVPTGKYSANRDVNISSNVVSLNPWYSFTLYPSKHSRKLEISGRVHYLWNSTNNSPNFPWPIPPTNPGPPVAALNAQPGQALHQNFSASYEIRRGLRIGYNGYALEQITDNKINGTKIAGSRQRVFGNGPGISFGGPGGLIIGIDGYMESGARNWNPSSRVVLRITKTFGPPPEGMGPPEGFGPPPGVGPPSGRAGGPPSGTPAGERH